MFSSLRHLLSNLIKDFWQLLCTLTNVFIKARFNRTEMWFCIASLACYILSVWLISFGDNPTRISLALLDLQQFFRGVALVFGGMCVSILCTRHSKAAAQNPSLVNAAIYAVRASITLTLVLAVIL